MLKGQLMGEGDDGNTDVAQLDPPARFSQLHRWMMGNPTARHLDGLKKQVNRAIDTHWWISEVTVIVRRWRLC